MFLLQFTFCTIITKTNNCDTYLQQKLNKKGVKIDMTKLETKDVKSNLSQIAHLSEKKHLNTLYVTKKMLNLFNIISATILLYVSDSNESLSGKQLSNMISKLCAIDHCRKLEFNAEEDAPTKFKTHCLITEEELYRQGK